MRGLNIILNNVDPPLALNINSIEGIRVVAILKGATLKPLINSISDRLHICHSITYNTDLTYDYLYALDELLLDYNNEEIMVKRS